ncbi:MAG: TetR/AcrR family transcriptional regulator [Oxalobacteraceae bacterium]|nr:MAG: TetR/AcrR family transcriptional regulator [Oxalobacteraceae bacterium]
MTASSKPAAARKPRRSMADDVREKKREDILSAAELLFFERGYAQTTVADIVDALGVTKPYLYYYFNGKDDIFEQLCWRASVACLTSMHGEAGDNRPAGVRLQEGLHRLALANIRYFRAGTFAYRETGALAAPFQARLRAMARQFHRELRDLLEQAKEEGSVEFGNPMLTSHAIGSVVGFMYTWYKPGGPIAQDDMADEITRILMNIAGFRQQPVKRRARTSGAKEKQ